jgi:hypothetical protein
MTRLVRWLIATTDQFPLIITDSEEGCISSKQFNLNFEKLHYFEHFIFYTFISATGIFISANRDLTVPCAYCISNKTGTGRSCLFVVRNANYLS